MAKQPSFSSGQLVTLRELPDLLRAARQQRGLSSEQLAGRTGLPPQVVLEAESTYRNRLRLRKRLLEWLTGYTLEGPYYRLTKRD